MIKFEPEYLPLPSRAFDDSMILAHNKVAHDSSEKLNERYKNLCCKKHPGKLSIVKINVTGKGEPFEITDICCPEFNSELVYSLRELRFPVE